MEYKKLRRGKMNGVFDIDVLNWHVEEYQQRIDRKIKAIVINNSPLSHRDRLKYICQRCGKSVNIKAGYFLDRNCEKHCRGCAITINHEKNPDWLIVTEGQRKKISERNSKLKITKVEERICPTCCKKFKVRLTAHDKDQIYDSKECCIKHWADYGKLNGAKYGYLGRIAVRDKLINTPELFMKEKLESSNIAFKFQKYIRINGKTHVFDFWIPSKNTLLEVDGDYWHYNTDIDRIAKRPPTKTQLDRILLDRLKDEYCKKNSITLIRIWESELSAKADELAKSLKSD